MHTYTHACICATLHKYTISQKNYAINDLMWSMLIFIQTTVQCHAEASSIFCICYNHVTIIRSMLNKFDSAISQTFLQSPKLNLSATIKSSIDTSISIVNNSSYRVCELDTEELVYASTLINRGIFYLKL